MLRRGAFILAVLLVSASASAEKLRTADGAQHHVTVLRVTDDGVVVKARKGSRTYKFDELAPPDAYRYMKRTVAADDAEGHLRLGRYCLKRELKQEAKAELLLAARIDPKLNNEINKIWAEANAEHPRVELTSEQVARIVAEQLDRGKDVHRVTGRTVATLDTDHFIIHTTFGKVEHKPLMMLCEKLYRGFDRIFRISQNNDRMWDGKCVMYLFADRGAFVKFAEEVHHYPGRLGGGYFRARGGQCEVVIPMLAGVDRFKETMVHEGAHAFLHFYRDPGHIPTWVHEGVAQYFEFTEFPESSMRQRRLHTVAAGVRSGKILPLRTLANSRRPTSGADGEAYAYSYSYVSYMIHKSPRKFADFVRALKAGTEPEEALETGFGWDFDEMQKRWGRAVARGL